MFQDRRRHARTTPAEGYLLSCISPDFAQPPRSLSTRLVDVSPGGACLASVGRLREGVPLLLDIQLPGAYARFRARAVVAWSRTVRDVQHLAGLRFEGVVEAGDAPAQEPVRASVEPRRGHKRYFPGRAEATFALRTLRTALGLHPRNRALRLVDLSRTGAQLVCDGPLKPGATGDLAFDFSRPRATVAGEARVVWCRRNTLLLAPEWKVGLAFRKIADPQSIRSLERHFLG